MLHNKVAYIRAFALLASCVCAWVLLFCFPTFALGQGQLVEMLTPCTGSVPN